MDTKVDSNKTCKHQGRNFGRLLRASGKTQFAVAQAMGTSQQTISALQRKEVIDDVTLQQISAALSVPVQIIKELEEDPATVIIENNTFEEGSIGNVNNEGDFHINNGVIDKVTELCREREILLERLVKLEQERNEELRAELAKLNDIKAELEELKKRVG